MPPLNPGAPTATEQGCTCPDAVNQQGLGAIELAASHKYGDVFVVSKDCPLHGEGTWRAS